MTFQDIVVQSKDDKEDFRAFLHCRDTNGFNWEIRGCGSTAGLAADDAWKRYQEGEDSWEFYGYMIGEYPDYNGGLMFTHGKNIECPECPGMGKRNRKPLLIVAERNYSGCSVDYGYCEECGKAWCISYKVDEMVRAPEWDGPSREECEEKEAEEALEKAKEKEIEDKRMLQELMEKYPGVG